MHITNIQNFNKIELESTNLFVKSMNNSKGQFKILNNTGGIYEANCQAKKLHFQADNFAVHFKNASFAREIGQIYMDKG